MAEAVTDCGELVIDGRQELSTLLTTVGSTGAVAVMFPGSRENQG